MIAILSTDFYSTVSAHERTIRRPYTASHYDTLIFLIDTFAKLFVDSSVITIHPKFTSNRMTLLSASTADIDCTIPYTADR